MNNKNLLLNEGRTNISYTCEAPGAIFNPAATPL